MNDTKLTHIMVDLETLGTRPGSAIFSIGAIKFKDNKIIGEFLGNPSLESNIDNGLTLDPHTIRWWMAQDDKARSQFENATGELKGVLKDFSTWAGPAKNLAMWGCGSDFDNALLAEAYKRCEMQVPWNFWNGRCYRTIKEMFPDIEPTFVGVKHNALDDAMAQAHHLIKIFKEHGFS